MIVAVALTLVCTRVTPRPEALVEVGAPVGSTPPAPHYVGFTMDYWNESQGNNWGPSSSVLTFPIDDARLSRVASALAPSSFRIGGSTADRTDYSVRGNECAPHDPTRNCLTMDRWLGVLRWAEGVGARVVFTLNGMAGRENSTSPWNSSNAADFLAYTRKHAPRAGALFAVGLGNELTNGACPTFPNCPPKVEPDTYAADVLVLRALLDTIWHDDPQHKPLLVAPDAGFATNLNITLQLAYFDRFLAQAGHAVDRVAYHMYIDGGNNPALPADLTNASYLDHWDGLFPGALATIVRRHAPHAAKAGLWADEIAAAWGSCGGGAGGGQVVCDRFMDGYWYIHQLGTLAYQGHTLFGRQTLRGGWYELLNQTTSEPHPDFYVAYMWRTWMTSGASRHTSASAARGQSPAATACAAQVRAFAATLPNPPNTSGGGDRKETVAVVTLNMCQQSEVAVTLPSLPGQQQGIQRHDYVFTPCSGDIHDNCVALGGKALRMSEAGDMPKMQPLISDAASPLVLPAGAYAWSILEMPLAPHSE